MVKLMDLRVNPKQYFFTMAICPVFLFWLTIVVYNKLFFFYPHTVLAASAGGFLSTMLGIMGGFGTKMSTGGYEQPYKFPMNFSLCLVFSLGTTAGLFSYDRYSYLTFLYGNSRIYQDALPSAQAASYADAGRFSFAREASIDQEKTVGYWAPDGHHYCIAPIKDLAEVSTYEFWAVGYDCCSGDEDSTSASGNFRCDGAEDPDSRGGIVVFDTPGWFGGSNKDKYDLARRKAEATFDLISASHPLYVRWVKTHNINKVEKFYRSRAWYFAFTSTFTFGVVQSGLAFLFKRSFYDRK